MQTKETKQKFPLFFLFAVSAVFCGLFLGTLFFMQIKQQETYRKKAENTLSLTVPVTAPRGDITDRYGQPLITNRPGYFVVLETNKPEKQKQHRAVLTVLLRTGYQPQNVPLQEEARLCKKFEIDNSFTKQERSTLTSIYYQLEQTKTNTGFYTLAEDVDRSLLLEIAENKEAFYGIAVQERPVRKSISPGFCTHLLGTVGSITQQEYETYQQNGYTPTDTIGKNGAEKAFESYLRGKNGVLCAPNIRGGSGERFVTEIPPQKGNTVMLTIDAALQSATENALKKSVLSKGSNKTIKGGAAVVLSVNTGEILASASYPTYTTEMLRSDYKTLANNSANPLFHRAFSGLYEPGSTFKPITAIAALEQGAITPEETMVTKGEYQLKNSTFRCNIFRTKGTTHGSINVSQALGVSCNYFFYDIAHRIGIDPIAKTAESFGLGDTTGSELVTEEAKGRIASEKNRKNGGGVWYPGDTLQAAIGQSDNLFSPLLLANYAATLANGGNNYQTTLLKAVRTPEGEVIKTTSPTLKNKVNMTPETQRAVKDGMIQVTQSGGTAASVFSDFPVTVAAKTGSAQVKGGTNGIFICYAPAEQPEIAVSVVLEHGDSGTKAAEVAKEVLTHWFQIDTRK